jgi:hypothetical protein
LIFQITCSFANAWQYQLHGDSAGDGVDHRDELHKGAIAHEFDDAAMAVNQQWVDHISAQVPNCGQRISLVCLDKPPISATMIAASRRSVWTVISAALFPLRNVARVVLIEHFATEL